MSGPPYPHTGYNDTIGGEPHSSGDITSAIVQSGNPVDCYFATSSFDYYTGWQKLWNKTALKKEFGEAKSEGLRVSTYFIVKKAKKKNPEQRRDVITTMTVELKNCKLTVLGTLQPQQLVSVEYEKWGQHSLFEDKDSAEAKSATEAAKTIASMATKEIASWADVVAKYFDDEIPNQSISLQVLNGPDEWVDAGKPYAKIIFGPVTIPPPWCGTLSFVFDLMGGRIVIPMETPQPMTPPIPPAGEAGDPPEEEHPLDDGPATPDDG